MPHARSLGISSCMLASAACSGRENGHAGGRRRKLRFCFVVPVRHCHCLASKQPGPATQTLEVSFVSFS